MIHTPFLVFCTAAVPWLCLPQQSAGSRQGPLQASKAGQATGYLREMTYLDANADGKIDAGELAAGQKTASMMLMLSWEGSDRDGNGGISLSELQTAAGEAAKALTQAETEREEDAEKALAQAFTLKLLLGLLSKDDRYADEIAALQEAMEDFGDEEAVVTHITKSPSSYAHLTPLIHTWLRYYPVRPELRRLATPRLPRAFSPSEKAMPGPKAGKPPLKAPPKTAGKPGPGSAKPGAKKALKTNPKPRPKTPGPGRP